MDTRPSSRGPEVEGVTPALVYICSPLKAYVADGVEYSLAANRRKVVAYRAFAFSLGAYGIAPHFDLTAFLDDTVAEDRAAGREMGLAMVARCDELWVFGHYISEGMLEEILLAFSLGKPIVWYPWGPGGFIKGLVDLRAHIAPLLVGRK